MIYDLDYKNESVMTGKRLEKYVFNHKQQKLYARFRGENQR